MHVIKVKNVNQALHEGLGYLKVVGRPAESRNGPVLVAPGPVATIYTAPLERVLFDPVRDANPVFHLMETLWMFVGSNDVEWLLSFNSNYTNYAEDDGKVHGAYGHRWRKHFYFDQLQAIAMELRAKPNSRRAVLQMWDAAWDLTAEKRDVPCNTTAYFNIVDGMLNMTVCCRSNDAVWGAYGANVVHFSMLQELLARWVGVEVGEYIQFSNNFHVYTENDVVKRLLPVVENDPLDPYVTLTPTPMFDGNETVDDFLADCEDLTNPLVAHYVKYRTHFFREVAYPLYSKYLARKRGEAYDTKFDHPTDWSLAFQEWVERRTPKEQA